MTFFKQNYLDLRVGTIWSNKQHEKVYDAHSDDSTNSFQKGLPIIGFKENKSVD